MIKVGMKLQIKDENQYFIKTLTYEVASQRLQDKYFLIFNDKNTALHIKPEEIYIYFEKQDSSINNGGSTDYYKFKENWNECADIIEDREMNYNQGNIFKSAFCFNIGRYNATDYERELNKIVYFANRELKRIEKDNL